MAGQSQQQTHKAKLTAAGCPDQTAASIASKLPQGTNPDHLAQLASLGPSFNWTLLETLIGQFGPSIIGALVNMFGVGGQGSQPPPQPAP